MEFHIKRSMDIWYEVEADSQKDAFNKVNMGEGEEIDREIIQEEVEEVFCACGGELKEDEEIIGVCKYCR